MNDYPLFHTKTGDVLGAHDQRLDSLEHPGTRPQQPQGHVYELLFNIAGTGTAGTESDYKRVPGGYWLELAELVVKGTTSTTTEVDIVKDGTPLTDSVSSGSGTNLLGEQVYDEDFGGHLVGVTLVSMGTGADGITVNLIFRGPPR